MSLPPDVQCVDAAQLLVWRPCGILDQRKVDKIIVFVTEQENKFGKSFNRFTDISRLDSVDLTFKYVFHVALYRRLSRRGRSIIKSDRKSTGLNSSHRCNCYAVVSLKN